MTHIFNTEDGNKNDAYKLSIIDYFIQNGNATVNDLAKFTGVSMPTASKLVGELCEAGYVNEYGKLETDEGRRPQLYGINPNSGYFLGVDFNQDVVNIGLTSLDIWWICSLTSLISSKTPWKALMNSVPLLLISPTISIFQRRKY